MELLRALASLMAPPDTAVSRVSTTLDLPGSPTPSEYAFLFQTQLPPFASIYLSSDGEAGGEPRDRIVSFWRAAGQTPPAGPDHLGLMLSLYADLLEQEERESDQARRHAFARLRKSFLWEHLLTWLPAYITKVDLIASRPYRRWGQLVEQVAAREAWRAGTWPSLPVTLQRLQEPDGASIDDADRLIAYVTAPGRSGLILAPIDLDRAADEAHATVPAGGVREGLRALCATRPKAVLGWLAGEAHRWELRHERNRDVLPALSDHWARRSRATRALLIARLRGWDAMTPRDSRADLAESAPDETASVRGSRPH